jgi:hypothetical protein
MALPDTDRIVKRTAPWPEVARTKVGAHRYVLRFAKVAGRQEWRLMEGPPESENHAATVQREGRSANITVYQRHMPLALLQWLLEHAV